MKMKLYLDVLSGVLTGQTLTLDPPGGDLGRDPTCKLHIPEKKISTRHLRLDSNGRYWRIQDLGSTNGTQLNGRRLGADPELLPKEGTLTVANVELRFRLGLSAVPDSPDRHSTLDEAPPPTLVQAVPFKPPRTRGGGEGTSSDPHQATPPIAESLFSNALPRPPIEAAPEPPESLSPLVIDILKATPPAGLVDIFPEENSTSSLALAAEPSKPPEQRSPDLMALRREHEALQKEIGEMRKKYASLEIKQHAAQAEISRLSQENDVLKRTAAEARQGLEQERLRVAQSTPPPHREGTDAGALSILENSLALTRTFGETLDRLADVMESGGDTGQARTLLRGVSVELADLHLLLEEGLRR